MKVASTLFAILISAGLSFGQGIPAEVTPDAAKSTVSYTADATVQANAGDQKVATYIYEGPTKKATTEGTVNHRIKAAATRADGDYTVADPQPAMEKSKKNDKKKAKQAKIR